MFICETTSCLYVAWSCCSLLLQNGISVMALFLFESLLTKGSDANLHKSSCDQTTTQNVLGQHYLNQILQFLNLIYMYLKFSVIEIL